MTEADPSFPDIVLPPTMGLYPVPESDTWAVRPGDLARNADYTYVGRLASEPRERAAAFLVLCSQLNQDGTWYGPKEGKWKSVSWLRLSHTVLFRADQFRYVRTVRREELWDRLTLGVHRRLRGPLLGLSSAMPFHSGGHTLIHTRKLPWGGEWVQHVADGLYELCEAGLVVRYDTRGPSPVFAPTEKLTNLLVQYKRLLRPAI